MPLTDSLLETQGGHILRIHDDVACWAVGTPLTLLLYSLDRSRGILSSSMLLCGDLCPALSTLPCPGPAPRPPEPPISGTPPRAALIITPSTRPFPPLPQLPLRPTLRHTYLLCGAVLTTIRTPPVSCASAAPALIPNNLHTYLSCAHTNLQGSHTPNVKR